MAGHSFNKVVRVKKWEERQQITAISKAKVNLVNNYSVYYAYLPIS
jgi:hypothetical protein